MAVVRSQVSMAAAPAPVPALAPKIDFSYLWGDERLADVTIRVKIKPAEEAEEEKEQARQEEPAAKRPRQEGGAAGAAKRPKGRTRAQAWWPRCACMASC